MSSEGPPLPPALSGQIDVLLIDNFDSFTWNLYQQICLLGGEVTVMRNDAIDAALLPQLNIKSLIISPGPGHPKTDSGISEAAIEYFQGKVPILGVCMGLECIVDVYGGTVGYAGEIKHGKLSRVKHDARGCFKGVPQGILSTRYHSLSASHTTLPPSLAITAITAESGVIMGVRHREYTIEGVQYHPESILSEGGDALLSNFLALKGGYWKDNPEYRVLEQSLSSFIPSSLPAQVSADIATLSKIPSILENIYAQRMQDVAAAQATPGTTMKDLETLYALNIAPPLISFVARIQQEREGSLALVAEIKRAAPAAGLVSVDVSPAVQAQKYALAGAHSVSILTEPKWFRGSLQDLLHARMSVTHFPHRPAILRKDFILSRYQVLESRIWGADTILLIVSMLPEPLLRDLYAYSLELGMEPLVEVNNAREMEVALSLPAKVIGVNNKSLYDSEDAAATTSRLSEMVKENDVILCALSGIACAEDARQYASEGGRAVLVGESLLRAEDAAASIREMLSLPETSSRAPEWTTRPPLVKICGIRTKDEALSTAEAGADMIGLVFVEKSKRFVDLDTAKEISQAIRNLRFNTFPDTHNAPVDSGAIMSWFSTHASRLSSPGFIKPVIVGVFQNAPLSHVLHIVDQVQLDIVQLHGSEPLDWAQQIPVPVIRVFHAGGKSIQRGLVDITRAGMHEFILLDSLRDDDSGLSGGSGKVMDLELAHRIVEAEEFAAGTMVARRSLDWQAEAVEAVAAADVEEDGDGDGDGNGNDDGNDDDAGDGAGDSTEDDGSSSTNPLPIILAGGLTPSNVSEIIARVHPWAVDVSGGVETEDGSQKDLDKVQAFIRSVKSG